MKDIKTLIKESKNNNIELKLNAFFNGKNYINAIINYINLKQRINIFGGL